MQEFFSILKTSILKETSLLENVHCFCFKGEGFFLLIYFLRMFLGAYSDVCFHSQNKSPIFLLLGLQMWYHVQKCGWSYFKITLTFISYMALLRDAQETYFWIVMHTVAWKSILKDVNTSMPIQRQLWTSVV